MIKKIVFTVYFESKSNSEQLSHSMSVPNTIYCSKFSDKYSVLHQARSGNEKTLDEVYTSRRDNGKGRGDKATTTTVQLPFSPIHSLTRPIRPTMRPHDEMIA